MRFFYKNHGIHGLYKTVNLKLMDGSKSLSSDIENIMRLKLLDRVPIYHSRINITQKSNLFFIKIRFYKPRVMNREYLIMKKIKKIT